MNILLLDNNSAFTPLIVNLLPGHNVVTKKIYQVPNYVENFDVVILSGGRGYSILHHEKYYQPEIQFILHVQKPVIGICLGAQLIAHMYGAKLEKLSQPVKGIISLELLDKTNPIFAGIDNTNVYESHKWGITTVSEELIPLAKSETGYEIIKHQTKPIWGLQFHPEKEIATTCGAQIFNKILKILNK